MRLFRTRENKLGADNQDGLQKKKNLNKHLHSIDSTMVKVPREGMYEKKEPKDKSFF